MMVEEANEFNPAPRPLTGARARTPWVDTVRGDLHCQRATDRGVTKDVLHVRRDERGRRDRARPR
jgi:hypothetical protein